MTTNLGWERATHVLYRPVSLEFLIARMLPLYGVTTDGASFSKVALLNYLTLALKIMLFTSRRLCLHLEHTSWITYISFRPSPYRFMFSIWAWINWVWVGISASKTNYQTIWLTYIFRFKLLPFYPRSWSKLGVPQTIVWLGRSAQQGGRRNSLDD